MHEACECLGPRRESPGRKATGGVWCAGGSVTLRHIVRMDLVNP